MSKNARHALTTVRIIFQFVDRQYHIQERLRSHRECILDLADSLFGRSASTVIST